MNRKSRNLSTEDRRAVDLVLDHGLAHRAVRAQVTTPAAQPRVAAATRLLAMLDAMPIAEPPSNLVARTMNFIAAATRQVSAAPTVAGGASAVH